LVNNAEDSGQPQQPPPLDAKVYKVDYDIENNFIAIPLINNDIDEVLGDDLLIVEKQIGNPMDR